MLKYQKLSILASVLLGLVACGNDAEKEPRSQSQQQPEMPALTVSCQDPAVTPNVRETLQKMVRDDALKLAATNYAKLIDVDKLAAAASLLEIDLVNIKGENNICTAQLVVHVPKRIASIAHQFAPILNMDSPNKIMQQRFSGSDVLWQNSTLNAPLGYTIAHNNQQFAITYSDTTLNRVSTALSVVIQPYGVRDMISVDGKNMTREQAVELINNPKPVISSEPESVIREVPVLPEKIETQEASAVAPTAVTPPPKPQNKFTAEQLATANQVHEAADRDIKKVWRNLDPIVQQSLIEEQKAWESEKRQRCLKNATQGATDSDARYLHMQCDTKLTHERIKYLQGYGIQ